MLSIFVIVLLILIGVYALSTADKKPTSQTQTTTNKSQILETKLQTATLHIPDGGPTVKLTNGKTDLKEGGYVMLGDVAATQNTSNGEDILVSFYVNYGGSGVFVYIGLFREIEGHQTLIAFTTVGDRVIVESITPGQAQPDDSYEVTIDYLDRTGSESMADTPTVTSKQVVTVAGDTMTVQK